MKFLSLLLLLSFSGAAMADRGEILLNELGFVDTIKSTDKANIVKQLGEPAKSVDLVDRDGAVFGSIWHYHFLNTSEDGDYYKTTELDFIGDQVVTVVFSNDDPEEVGALTASPESDCTTTC